ncbi:MAG: ATP-binding protein [Clostridia bacterium]|nr:ATP-binding protein [Clostridia bacterium]
MDNEKYKKRIIDSLVDKYISIFGAVCIEGPKLCGKSWTSSYHCNSQFFVGDPGGGFQNRRLAELSPYTVLAGEAPRLIDEWQEVPLLWDAVRHEVDVRGLRGQFILTGSSTPQRKGVLHSGAGRYGFIRMNTMTLYETGDSSGEISLSDICNGIFTTVLTGEVNIYDLAKYVIRGGWPNNLDLPDDQIHELPQNYITAILHNDFYKLENAEFISENNEETRYNADKMFLLLESLARNESTAASKNKLRNDISGKNGADNKDSADTDVEDKKLHAATINLYLDELDNMFITDNQPPFHPNIRSSIRVKQMEKRHFCDPSLACALLNVKTPDWLVNNLNTFGFMFEALVEHDLKVYAQSFGGKLYHYQDYNTKNNEIDAVIELDDGSWCAFEIKLGHNEVEDAAKQLVAIRDSFLNSKDDKNKAPSVLCVICGLSNAAYLRPDGVYVVPITALKN